MSKVTQRARDAVRCVLNNNNSSKAAHIAEGVALGQRMPSQMRSRPYTDIGISRVRCLRCDKPSSTQWRICATGSKWAGVCTDCDIELNALVVDFMGLPKRLADEYEVDRRSAEHKDTQRL